MLVFQLVSDRFRYEPIDIFVSEPFDFEAEFSRAVWKQINEEVSVSIISVARLFALKRAAARPRDLADIEELGGLHVDENRAG